jgi:Na+/melibiose symporter-like transporter
MLSPLLVPVVYLGTDVLLFAFIAWELRQAEPVVQVRLFATRTFRAATVSEACMNVAFFPIMLALAVFMEDVQGHPATLAGVVLAIGSTATVLGSLVGGRPAARLGRRRPALVGRGVAVLGTLSLLTLDATTRPVVLGLWLLIMSFGSGLSWATVQAAAVASAPALQRHGDRRLHDHDQPGRHHRHHADLGKSRGRRRPRRLSQ